MTAQRRGTQRSAHGESVAHARAVHCTIGAAIWWEEMELELA
jgi:hypothetical protein